MAYINKNLFEMALHDHKVCLFDLRRRCIVRTVTTVINEDYKTALSKKMPAIPAGTELQVIDHIYNCYGHFLIVSYSNFYYYINPLDVEYVRMEGIS